MDLNTGLVVAAGAAVLVAGGGYRFWLWHKKFRAPQFTPPPVVEQPVKAKRKYTKKPKAAPAVAATEQMQQEPMHGANGQTQWPLPTDYYNNQAKGDQS